MTHPFVIDRTAASKQPRRAAAKHTRRGHAPQPGGTPIMTAQTVERAPIAPQLYRIPDVISILRLSRSVIYELIRSGRLRTVKEGGARLVPASAIAEYVALLEAEAGQGVSR